MMQVDHREVMRDALLDAASTIVAREQEPKPPALVMAVLTEAMETLRRMPDREAAWLFGQRSLWPDIVHDYQERLEAYQEDLKRWMSGEDLAGELRRRMPAGQAQIKRMYVVFDDFPLLMVGREKRRDYRILCGLASGKGFRRVALEARCSKSAIENFRDLQLTAIANKLRYVMPTESDLDQMKNRLELKRRAVEDGYKEKSGNIDVLDVA
jgi:hypothetical protein